MREYGKTESTARSYITGIRNGNMGLMTVNVAGIIAIDKEKICEFEDALEYMFMILSTIIDNIILYEGKKNLVKRREFEHKY